MTMLPGGEECCLSPRSPASPNDNNPDEVVKRWSRSPRQPNRWQLRRPTSAEEEDETEQEHDDDNAKEDGGDKESALPPFAPEIASRNADPSKKSPELMDLIVAKSWHRAARLCEGNPMLALYREGVEAGEEASKSVIGPTCLFLACQHRPPVRVVRALLRAHPDAARVECPLVVDPTPPDNNTDANMDAPSTNRGSSSGDKWLPLHMACRYNSSLSVLRALLEHHPRASLGGASSSSYPINELYEYRDTFESSFAPTNYRSVFWQKVGALLQAMAACQNSTLVHVAALSGIPDVLEYALSDFAFAAAAANVSPSPSLSSYPLNAQGQTPLHLALIHAAAPAPATIHSTLSTNVLTIATRLLAHDASLANVPDPHGRYPLHTALNLHSHPNVHPVALKILQTEPASVILRDPVTRLYPFQMAASLTTVAADVVDVEVVYRILRTHPSALGRCRSDSPRGSGSDVGSSACSVADSRLAEVPLPAEPRGVDSVQAEAADPALEVPGPYEPFTRALPCVHETAQTTKYEVRADDHGLILAEPRSQVPEEITEPASSLLPRSCPASPAKSHPASVSLSSSAHRGVAAKSISLSDFLQSPRTKKKKKKKAVCASRESSAVTMMAFEAASADDTCLVPGTVDSDDDSRDNPTTEGSVAIPVESDPIVRSINGMCSGALLLLTTMFHQSATDLSSSHHSKKKR